MRRGVTFFIVGLLVAVVATPASARAAWKTRIDELTAGRTIGVAVREEGRFLYRHAHKRGRVPASNQKLLLSMALVDDLDPATTIGTSAASRAVGATVLEGDLWLLGHGDPTVTGGGRFGKQLPFEPTQLGALARSVKAAGVGRIQGRVMGNTGYFDHDWNAPGWKAEFADLYIPLPSALTFEGNTYRGTHVSDPERRAAISMTRASSRR